MGSDFQFRRVRYFWNTGRQDNWRRSGAHAVLATAGLFDLHLGEKGALPSIPIYVVLAAHAAIALGTLAGGWRIVHTMGSKITKLRPVDGFCVETAGAVTLFGATMSGIPVLTTRTQSPAQLPGVGSTTRLSAVKWRVDYSDSLGLGLYDPGSSDIRGDIIFVNRIDSHNRHAADLAASIRL